MKRRIQLAFWGLILVLSHSINAEEIAVIVKAGWADSSLSKKQLKRIYLGRLTKWPSGSMVMPIDYKEGGAIRETFYSKVVKTNPRQLKAYWTKRVFAGKGAPPQVVANEHATKVWVVQNPGAVGYISKSLVDDTVKVVSIID